MIMAVSILAPSCFAAKETANTQKGANFKIEKTTPENNAKNVSVENLSVKIYFDTEMLPEAIRLPAKPTPSSFQADG